MRVYYVTLCQSGTGSLDFPVYHASKNLVKWGAWGAQAQSVQQEGESEGSSGQGKGEQELEVSMESMEGSAGGDAQQQQDQCALTIALMITWSTSVCQLPKLLKG